MSIKPPSDLLLDVARAADPATAAAAAERLAKIAAEAGQPDAAFAKVLSDVGGPSAAPVSLPAADAVSGRKPMPKAAPVNPAKKAYEGLEALLLQNLAETMLPKSSDLFGKGGAGMVWRSMLAQQLGEALAKRVNLGIEPAYLRDYHEGESHHAASTDGLKRPPHVGVKPA